MEIIYRHNYVESKVRLPNRASIDRDRVLGVPFGPCRVRALVLDVQFGNAKEGLIAAHRARYSVEGDAFEMWVEKQIR